MSNNGKLGASFRDPSGFLFTRESVLYRQVNQAYQADYDLFMSSGLYEKLVSKNFLIPHQEVDQAPADPALAYKILQPERINFISYPYEWSFSQLKDAALATLSIQKRALKYGMTLKDASAYNIQFRKGKPVLIDTLSFEKYRDGEPWTAYRQFCQHFLAPLALMAYQDIRLNQLLRIYIVGVPLTLASRLLPGRTRFNLPLLMHIHSHAAAERRYADKTVEKSSIKARMSKEALIGLVDSLKGAVAKLSWKPSGTEWGDYYTHTHNYAPEAQQNKRDLVKAYIDRIRPGSVWDLGANTGMFSRLSSDQGIATVAFDIDPAAVELCYLEIHQNKESNLLPLVLDLTNPSPGLGWNNDERMSFLQRGPVDAVMALALIHHLAISNNVPLPLVASFFHQLSHWLIIEFVPKSDSQVRRLLATRQDIFPTYTQEGFEQAFASCYKICDRQPIPGTERTLYLMEAL